MSNLKNNKYAKRLLDEWRQHGKIIIAVDFDSTISSYHTIDNQDDIKRVIYILKVAKEVGCYLVIHTACNKSRYEEISKYCDSIGLKIDSINETPVELPYGKEGSKIYANIFIDDRAGLLEALNILEFCTYAMRSEKHSSSEQTVEF